MGRRSTKANKSIYQTTREDLGLTREKAGEIIPGFSPERIEKIENGRIQIQPDDVLLVTADHGCDPTWKGTDHTREKIPVLFYGQNVKPQQLPPFKIFSDIGQTLANYLGVGPLGHGTAVDIWK